MSTPLISTKKLIKKLVDGHKSLYDARIREYVLPEKTCGSETTKWVLSLTDLGLSDTVADFNRVRLIGVEWYDENTDTWRVGNLGGDVDVWAGRNKTTWVGSDIPARSIVVYAKINAAWGAKITPRLLYRIVD